MGCVFCRWWRYWFPFQYEVPEHDCFYERLQRDAMEATS